MTAETTSSLRTGTAHLGTAGVASISLVITIIPR
jgi:hypothetical protein